MPRGEHSVRKSAELDVAHPEQHVDGPWYAWHAPFAKEHLRQLHARFMWQLTGGRQNITEAGQVHPNDPHAGGYYDSRWFASLARRTKKARGAPYEEGAPPPENQLSASILSMGFRALSRSSTGISRRGCKSRNAR